jgi:hypothetical protein
VNFLDQFLRKGGRPVPIPALASLSNSDDMVDEALKRLVDDNVSDDSRQSIKTFARTVTNPQERAASIAYLVLASPEYQLI